MFTDMTIVRSLFTVIAFALFIAVVLWTWSASRKTAFEEAATLPFADEPSPQAQAGDAR
nr:cbb3-type cytochrome c oxidase subunit 3 [Pseudomonas sp.]